MPAKPLSPRSPAGLIKRSLSLDGHRTSLALEPEFWAALEAAAAARALTLAALVAEIDRTRAARGQALASALRVFALQEPRYSGPT